MFFWRENRKGFTQSLENGIASTKRGETTMPFFSAGFTLIELLIVIAIIGVLSSIVMANLNNSRNRAKDAAVKLAMGQMANLMALEYSATGSYCNLQYGWITAGGGTCDTVFSGSYVNEARAICKSIFNNAGENGWSTPGAYKIYSNTGLGCASTYSFMIYLNKGKWYCSGSSGRKGEYAAYSNVQNGSDIGVTPGCYMQP
ncbi:MAG: hypothetical protein A2431_01885 [Candidatus Zambryskibacteria bacterium RIFOXYC1_FULL_39_10]|uniref:Type II secretion system protein GspG C-terminal domain-containing protein n=1 Tax=Candidatus Zambryskibacteria bacterium RIFOXYC1_FULL_39_10 TaxID=1802779 RepID=A0A1G2V462_9BACT|nr:MAG: hypothetical protein A2605_02845 [Candidatus Zambryskibacteria bacterium RIFOXYD1_FULL_39_35]OHB16426.1 MAG: hypothetical protein A2431_01885 [Candidatus Zambryskibacteria bacterium RIFOXYC1_FULL_39_10]